MAKSLGRTYLSSRIFATSMLVFNDSFVLSSLHRSYSSPMYILFLFNRALASRLFRFLSESVSFTFGPRFPDILPVSSASRCTCVTQFPERLTQTRQRSFAYHLLRRGNAVLQENNFWQCQFSKFLVRF